MANQTIPHGHDPQNTQVPLTNVYALGDYTAQFHIGSEKTPVNLLIDTGSSTLVIDEAAYQSGQDQQLVATSLAQEVNYGIGGWDGPVIKTRVTLQAHQQEVTLSNCHLALVSATSQAATFGNADGIVGMAYQHLNKSFDLSDYLSSKGVHPALTYPWPFASADAVEVDGKACSSDDLKAFKSFLWQQPEQDLLPYFNAVEELGLTANKFAFYGKRSSIHVAESNACEQTLKADPLNQGWLILGGGEEHEELYQGDFQSVTVQHDCYYNVVLKGFQVGDQQRLPVAPIDPQHLHNYFSNAIVDTGASALALTHSLYQAMLDGFTKLSKTLVEQVQPFADLQMLQTGIDANTLDLSQWPDLHFYFAGESGEVKLTCKPETYWQLNSPVAGKAVFKIISQLPNWPDQSLIGLPLLTNYFVVFDRAAQQTGVIRFAAIR